MAEPPQPASRSGARLEIRVSPSSQLSVLIMFLWVFPFHQGQRRLRFPRNKDKRFPTQGQSRIWNRARWSLPVSVNNSDILSIWSSTFSPTAQGKAAEGTNKRKTRPWGRERCPVCKPTLWFWYENCSLSKPRAAGHNRGFLSSCFSALGVGGSRLRSTRPCISGVEHTVSCSGVFL